MHYIIKFIIAICIPVQIFAARPLVTDDARITAPGSCQLESWSRFEHNAYELWALPACNPSKNFEITVGRGDHHDSDGISKDYIAQFKTLFKEYDETNFGYGLVAGINHLDNIPQEKNQENYYAYVPLSIAVPKDITLHINLGGNYEINTHQTLGNYGIGTEIPLTEKVIIVAENYGDSNRNTYIHGGLRFWLIPNKLQIDMTTGKNLKITDEYWMSIGIRILGSKWF